MSLISVLGDVSVTGLSGVMGSHSYLKLRLHCPMTALQEALANPRDTEYSRREFS